MYQQLPASEKEKQLDGVRSLVKKNLQKNAENMQRSRRKPGYELPDLPIGSFVEVREGDEASVYSYVAVVGQVLSERAMYSYWVDVFIIDTLSFRWTVLWINEKRPAKAPLFAPYTVRGIFLKPLKGLTFVEFILTPAGDMGITSDLCTNLMKKITELNKWTECCADVRDRLMSHIVGAESTHCGDCVTQRSKILIVYHIRSARTSFCSKSSSTKRLGK